MSIQKYLAFVKTVEVESFTKAALALNYSQSGISRMINDLEKEWGVTLLERSRAGLRLTSDGQNIFPAVKKLTEDHAFLESRLDEINGLESGIVKIGTFSSVATHWIPRMIRHFRQNHPNVEFELLLGDYKEIEKWIAEGRVNFGFIRLPTLPEFKTIFLEKDEELVVLPDNHPLAENELFPVERLKYQPFILLESSGDSDISELFEIIGPLPDIRYRTWDDHAVMSMVENGLGISILPALIFNRAPYPIVAKKMDPPLYRKIGIAYRSVDSLSLATRTFLEYVEYRSS